MQFRVARTQLRQQTEDLVHMNMFTKGATALLFAGAVSAATIDFQPGNPVPGSNEVLVHFTGELTGLLESGLAGPNIVTFQSTNVADLLQTHPGGGVSFITGAGSGLVQAPITFRLPLGLTFGDFSFNLQCGQGCAPAPHGARLTFAATFADGSSNSLAVPFGNGANRFTAYAVESPFTSVTFGATVPYSHAEQIKVSEVQASSVPEPRTFGLVGLALVALSTLLRKRLA
jgi:hypothetical protein